MLTGRRTLVRSRAAEDSEVIELTRDQLLSFVQTDPQLGEIFMRAFILRRIELIERHRRRGADRVGAFAGHARIREFLTRNGYPYTYIDLDHDADVQEMLDRFHVTVHDVPVVICRGDMVLRNPTNQQVAECSASTRPSTPRTFAISSSSAPVPRGWRPRCTAPPKASTCWCSKATRPAARRDRARRSRTTWDFRPASRARSSPGGPTCRRRSSAHRSMIAREAMELTCDRSRTASRSTRRRDSDAGDHHCDRRRVSQAAARQHRGVRGRRHLLRRDVRRGAVVRRRGSRGRRRRQFRRPGGSLPRQDRQARPHAGQSGRALPTRCRAI